MLNIDIGACAIGPLSMLSVCLSVCPVCITFVHCGQTVGRIKMKLDTQVCLGLGHIVLDGDPAPLPQRGTAPQFSAHICCGQMAASIKMSLGMEVGLGPGDFVLDGEPAPPPQKGVRPPKFFVHVYWGQTAGWMKLVLGWYSPQPRRLCVRWGPSPLPPEGCRTPLPNFWLLSIVEKRL